MQRWPPRRRPRGARRRTSPTPRRRRPSKCMLCDEAIAKGEWRVAVEREVDAGSFTRPGPGYLHPRCAIEQTGDDELLAKIKTNSAGLRAADAEQLAQLLALAD